MGLNSKADLPGEDIWRSLQKITWKSYYSDTLALLSAGCNGYIEKPINPETIMGEIAAYLERPGGQTMKILIVDDNDDNLYMLEALLKGNGYQIISARDGVEALDLLKSEGAAMIISDILMPRMDGFKLCREVKSDDALKGIPFLFYTATYTDPEDIKLGLSLGAERFLIKPQDTDEFLRVIKGVIGEAADTASNEYPLGEEMEFFRQYNEILFKKLEKKISDLKQANYALIESEERFRNMFEQSPVAYQSLDEQGRYIYANDQLCRLLGYGIEELKGKSFGDFWSPETRGMFSEKFAAFKKSVNIRAELQLLRKTGELLEAHIEGRVQSDANGRFIETHCIVFDVTERKRIENSLQASVLQMTAILNNIPDMAWLKDTGGRFIAVNAPFGAAAGLHPQEVTGKTDFDIWPEELAKLYWEDDAEVMHSGHSKRVEERLVDHEGKESWIETIKSPVFDPKGAVIGTTGIARDITVRRRAEAEKALLEEQLRQAQKMEAIGQLAGGVAHDFNNMLTAIIGYASLALEVMAEDDPNRHNIDQILGSSNKAAVLTQSLLAFSRKQVVTLGRLNLNQILAQFEKFLLRLLREDIELRSSYIPDELPVMADRGQIEQVLMNLVTNARDAMPKGGRIIIETSLIELDKALVNKHGFGEAGEYALLSVTDTGEGMPEDVKRKIFEPFFTTKTEGKGTGLGLAVVYGIVKQHNGSIDVYSEPGIGTTIKIYLPLDRGPAEVEIQKDKEQVPPMGGNETILVAEDNARLRELTVRVLRNYGYTVIEAVDGLDALAKTMENRDRINLVLLDGIMPNMNGKEAWQEIKALNQGIKAVFMSGYAEDIFAKDGIPGGEAFFIQKPAPPSVIVQKIRAALDA